MIERRSDSMHLTVAQLEKQLINVYTSLVEKNVPFKVFPSVMLWGPPGVGKSQSVKHIAAKIEEETDKKVVVTDVRLLLFNPVDLRGIPTSNEDKTLAVWLKPKIFQMDESSDVINILFLDEITAAPQSVQAAAYQITLDRTVGEHKLPDNCIVIAAGNRVTDKSVAFHMPKALANRLCHIEVIGEEGSWHEWAVKNDIHKFVIGFLDYNPQWLMDFEPTSTELAFPTPRSWEMVSNILNYVSDDIAQVFPLISGCVGKEAAYAIRTWSEMYDVLPDVKEVFDGTLKRVPNRPEVALAFSTQITEYMKTHHSPEEVRNALEYVFVMPQEYRGRILSDFLAISSIRKILKQDDRFIEWFMRSGREWDDYQ